MSKLRAIHLLLIFGMLSGCDTQRLNQLQKQNEELKAQGEKDHVVRDYDLQARCARDARLWFNENWRPGKDTIMLTFSNHYYKVGNQCFALVENHYSMDKTGSWINELTLWNIYAKFAIRGIY